MHVNKHLFKVLSLQASGWGRSAFEGVRLVGAAPPPAPLVGGRSDHGLASQGEQDAGPTQAPVPHLHLHHPKDHSWHRRPAAHSTHHPEWQRAVADASTELHPAGGSSELRRCQPAPAPPHQPDGGRPGSGAHTSVTPAWRSLLVAAAAAFLDQNEFSLDVHEPKPPTTQFCTIDQHTIVA